MITKRTILFLTAAVLLCWMNGCSTQQAATKVDTPAVAAAPVTPPPYFIQPGDQLQIKFFYNPELNETETVRPDGKISLQLIDEVQAAGLTPAQLDEFLTEQYSKELRKPAVTVIVGSFSSQRVYVGGEVNRQGLVDLTGGMTALQAVLSAGGFKETADLEAAIIIRKGPDNQPVPVRVNLKNALEGDLRDAALQLRPYDVVYVPKTWIAEANKFVKQYVEDLLLYRGVSLGFSYDLNNYNYNR
jgi:polysaccharide export outer membrane protein